MEGSSVHRNLPQNNQTTLLVNCLYRKPKQTAINSFMQCEMLIIDVSCFIRWEKATMICVVVLQNCMYFVEGETGCYNETCVTCDVETEEVSIKVEDARDIKEEVSIKVEEAIDIKDEIPEATGFSSITTEHEVRLRCVCEVVAAHTYGPFIAPQRKF